MTDPRRNDFADAAEVIRGSRAWRILDGAVRVWRSSADDSRFVSIGARGRLAFERLGRQERRRTLAIGAAAAAAAHALLLGLVPVALRPAMPRAFWVVIAVAATGVAFRKSGGNDQASDA